MKKSFLIFIVLFTACIRPEEPPEGVIPKDTMAHIFMDIHIAEAKVSTRAFRPDSAQLYYQVYREKIYHKYKIDPKRFEKSFDYYMRNLREMDQIYGVVVDSLGLMEGRGHLE